MNYLVERNDLNLFEYDILKSLKLQSLIHTRLHNEDNKMTLEYSVGSFKLFKDVIDYINFDEEKVVNLFKDYVQLSNEISDVLLEMNQVSFDVKDVYFDEENQKIKLIYYPFHFENTSSFKNVIDLLLDKLNTNNFDSALLVLLYEYVRTQSEESINKIVKYQKSTVLVKEKQVISSVKPVNEVKPIIRETKPVEVIQPNKKEKQNKSNDKKEGFLSKLFSSKPKVEKVNKPSNKPTNKLVLNKPSKATPTVPANNGETVLLSSETTLLSSGLAFQCTLTRSSTNEVISIQNDTFSLGSGAQADYQVTVAGVSRLHAKIIYVNGAYYIHDMNSTNGTFVNDQRLIKGGNQMIHNNDVIRLGNESFVFNT